VLRRATQRSANAAGKLRLELQDLVGEEDANALLSRVNSDSEQLASLGLIMGLANILEGKMSRAEYLQRHGHRGTDELELAAPRHAEDPEWLDKQLAEYRTSPVDVETLLARQQAAFHAAWQRFQTRYPRKARSMRRRIETSGIEARRREAIRSEMVRVTGVVRKFALRAGALSGIGDDIFFLSLDEMIELLGGNQQVTGAIAARRATHDKYRALPRYPAIINGRFEPFRWAADPNRRTDLYDEHAPLPTLDGETITGFAGAAGRVEGYVRLLDSPAEGDQLQPGEILVAVTTNIGWTPLFPRVAAIITDVGAPLSHAAIVARELGIPAVVGCGSATLRLQTGDKVLVDGGQGIVTILEQRHASAVQRDLSETDEQSDIQKIEK
jgi:rifampicin phosphotransferase